MKIGTRGTALFLAALLFGTAIGFTQATTSTLGGLVQDSQGGLVPNAEVVVVNTLTGQSFTTKSDVRGQWVIASLPTATYSVTVTVSGFKKATVPSIKMDAGVPATANVTLEIGSVAEAVEVVGGSEVVQSTTATVSAVLTPSQVKDLPIPSRNATDLLVTQAGTQTPAGPRNTTFYGLPQSTVNMTYDGINIQDNLLKNSSGGAFYPIVYPRTDAIEEVSVTTAAAGAESLGEGAVQVKFVTKSGTNAFHGGVFIQERNTAWNANTYFNNIDGLPRDRIILHQIGANIGGPIIKNRVFFFFNYEIFRFPQSWNSGQLTVLNDTARSGVFTYADTTGKLVQRDLYALAAARNPSLPSTVRAFPTTADPIIAGTLSQIAQLTAKGGSFSARTNDFNRQNFTFLAPGSHKIDFPRVKLDANLTAKHHIEGVFNIDPYLLFPDGINGIIPIFPGTGTVLGSSLVSGQREEFWTAVTAVRSAWSQRWTSEVRFGVAGGNVLFSDGINSSLFAPWRGYAPVLGYVTNPYNTRSPSRRNDPVRQLNANVSYGRSGHFVQMGGSFSRINEWIQSISTQQIPTITFGVAGTDPVNFGTTSIFDTVNFPNSSPTDRTNAASLYALLTGRVQTITRTSVLDENTKTYGPNPAVDRIRQQEFGLFIQDSWKIRPRVTLNYGLRFENQFPFQSLSGTYTRPGYEGLWGLSGVGNLFKPNTFTGKIPQYTQVDSSSVTGYPPTRFWSPSVGLAWRVPERPGVLGRLIGKGAVLRGGYSVTSTRGDLQGITGVWGNNQGRTLTTTVDATNNAPEVFGPAGSVLFRDPTLPARTVASTPSYPLAVAAGNSLSDYDPDLKSRYVESWTVGLQRPLSENTIVEVRYVGNRLKRQWANLNLNEVNIFESGFLSEFKAAQANLALTSTSQFAGLAGQSPLPILQTALGANSDTTIATQIRQGQAGVVANAIANNSARMTNLTRAGYPANLFEVNPTNVGAGANVTTNQGGTNYNSLQIELRRRLSGGLQMQASYVWSHSLVTGNLLTLRNRDGYTAPSPFDQRHAIKASWLYELPIGPRHRLFGGVQNSGLRRIVEGWQFSGVTRIQSGTPSQIFGSRGTVNNNDAGVVLYNMTTAELQDKIQIRKEGNGLVYWLPQSLIDNTLAAFQLNTKTLDPSQPYIGPPTTSGQFGNQVFLYGPWFQKWDFNLIKHTRIGEKRDLEFRVQALNAFNVTNFFLVANSAGNLTINSATFGQTRNAFRDINSTNDPGSRVVEFGLRFTF